MANTNKKLKKAKAAKKDEFYTRLEDIENQLKHYRKHFENKTVLCNCDDPRISNFFTYFSYNFEALKLKRLITTCYKNQQRDLFSQYDSESAIWLEYTGDKNNNAIPDPEEIGINKLNGDGDFRSEECVRLLEESDVVVTNPPFSLFREYVAQLIEYEKKFVIIGNINAITYKEIFPLIRDNKIWLGYPFENGDAYFYIPDDADTSQYGEGVYDPVTKRVHFRNCCWFTNLDIEKRHEDFDLFQKYDPDKYPTYDNLNGIDVSEVVDIPYDYSGIMGVPASFLDKYNPDQFELLGIGTGELAKNVGVKKNYRGRTDLALTKNGKSTCPFSRILIRNKHPEKPKKKGKKS